MNEDNQTEKPKKTWTAPILVEYGEVGTLTQSKGLNVVFGSGDGGALFASDF